MLSPLFSFYLSILQFTIECPCPVFFPFFLIIIICLFFYFPPSSRYPESSKLPLLLSSTHVSVLLHFSAPLLFSAPLRMFHPSLLLFSSLDFRSPASILAMVCVSSVGSVSLPDSFLSPIAVLLAALAIFRDLSCLFFSCLQISRYFLNLRLTRSTLQTSVSSLLLFTSFFLLLLIQFCIFVFF